MADKKTEQTTFDRRQLIAATAGLAGAAVAVPAFGAAEGAGGVSLAGMAHKGRRKAYPHDTFRDWMQDLEARGLVMRIKRLDQDAYEMTALAYRLMDCFGMYEAPAVLVEEVKINGQWVK
jgi:hypothetical protein